MRKPRSISQTTWAKPTTSVIRLVRQRSTKTPENLLEANLDILVMADVAAANLEKIGLT